jgi:hypothetical protein
MGDQTEKYLVNEHNLYIIGEMNKQIREGLLAAKNGKFIDEIIKNEKPILKDFILSEIDIYERRINEIGFENKKIKDFLSSINEVPKKNAFVYIKNKKITEIMPTQIYITDNLVESYK